MSKPNFFRFKRKLNATTRSDSVAPAAKLSKKDNEPGKIQTTLSKFFMQPTSNQKKKINGNDDTTPCEEIRDTATSDDPMCSTSAARLVRSKEIVLSTSTLNKLQEFSQHNSRIVDQVNEASKQDTIPQLLQDFTAKKISPLSRSKLDKFVGKHVPTKPDQEKLSPIKYTPFEQQIIDLKSKYPGMILLVESGYKYRFFGEDAKIASEELNIMANMDHNFLTSSIPNHRLHVHIRRLVENGHKVGVVKQTETAALKASSTNKSSLFSRELSAIYTKATLIGEDVEPASGSSQEEEFSQESTVCSMACIAELPLQGKLPLQYDIGIVILEPATGEATFDSFVDFPNRAELEKRLNHTRPVEIIVSKNISSGTEHLLTSRPVRIEYLPNSTFELSEAISLTTDFLGDGSKTSLEALSPCVIRALAALIIHLKDFGLSKALSPDRLNPFTTKDTVLQLDASTVKNLELFETSLLKNKGSLCWVLDHTKTSFGCRLLKRWVSQPLCILESLQERQDAVAELLRPEVADVVTKIRNLLAKLPDLEKDLTCVLHGKSNTAGFASLVSCLSDLFHALKLMEVEIWSTFCNEYVESLFKDTVQHLQGVVAYQENLNLEAAREGDKTKLLKDWSQFPDVVAQLEAIASTSQKLQDLRPKVARTLGMLSIDYVTVSGMEYLIEVKNNICCKVPTNWAKVSTTKQVVRWRPPEVASLVSELSRHRELLAAACNAAWLVTLKDFSRHYYEHKAAVANLAILDVLMSFAQISKQEGFCKPQLHDGEPGIMIKNGRHPILSHLSSQDIVANDTSLGLHERCMIITGPNMGGKSSYIRQVGLLVIMAQIGCYIPAESATISLVDAIFTRMGSRDELHHGRSTLLVELEEASVVLSRATPRSLAILDELGRGTSSCDGAAIAVATLQHIVTEVKCLTLFVTHYPVVMTLEQQFPSLVSNYHMGFTLLNPQEKDAVEVLVFLYHLERGGAHHSYGLNVARLADLPADILTRAAEKAHQLQQQVVVSSQRYRNLQRIFSLASSGELKEALHDLRLS